MLHKYYQTDLGIVVKDNESIRLKSSITKKILSEEEFNNSNPIKINKGKYLEKLNIFFKNIKHEWEYNGTKFKKLDNFELDSSGAAFFSGVENPKFTKKEAIFEALFQFSQYLKNKL